MLLRTVFNNNIGFLLKRSLHKSTTVFNETKFDNPTVRNILGSNKHGADKIPTHADVVIIGGGAIGSSTAYWLTEKSRKNSLSVAVIEKDLTYAECSTCRSNGGLRQQYSLPENIHMTVYGAEFIKSIKERFGPDADVNFFEHGYLMLANDEGAEVFTENSKLQNELGAVNIMLGKHELKDRFPWLNVDDVAIGFLGLEKEGWFDPWSLLQLYKGGAVEKGCRYINAKAVDFVFENGAKGEVNDASYEHPTQVVIETAQGERRTIAFELCVIAAGAQSAKIAELLKIGVGDGVLSVPLPVEPRKRYVHSFSCQDDPPGLYKTPMVIDHTGAFFRRNGLGGDFIGGISPKHGETEPDTSNLEVELDWFDERVWPILAHRVPAFNAIKANNGWGGFYEFNTFDENGIIGKHPYYKNIYMATGFSGHGIQQSPAVGRSVAELIIDGSFQTIDLTRLGFDRILLNKPMKETYII